MSVTVQEVIAASGVPLAPFIFVLGLLVGSFLNVVIARVPAGQSIVRPRSRCPHCGYMIPSWLNVPVLSWVALRGRCASCRTPISVRYPIVELLTGVLFLACFRQFGLSWALLLGLIFCGGLLAITFIDIDTFEIPDEISLPGILIGALLRPLAFEVDWWSGLAAAALATAALLGLRWGFAAIRGIEGMGLGDVKLLAMIGAFLGAGALLPTLMVASIVGLVVGAPLTLAARRQEADEDEGEGAEEGAFEDDAPPAATIRLTALVQAGRRTRRLFGKDVPATRSHVRFALTFGVRGRSGPGLRALVGLVHDQPGWGLFDGVSRGLREDGWGKGLKAWLGVMAGEREPLADDEEEPWTPPKGAIPFGPFLALGAMFTLLYGHNFERWLFLLTS